MTETPVTKPVRTAIKIAARVAQTARFISLMPTPQDFATRICGDVIYMSALLQKFVKDINKMLEEYSNIPFDYLNNQLNSILDSAHNTLERANKYTDYIIDNSMNAVKQNLEIGAELYDMTIDLGMETAAAAASFGKVVSATGKELKGDHETAQAIMSSADAAMNSSSDRERQNAFRDGMTAIQEAENRAIGVVDSVIGSYDKAVDKAGQFVQSIIDKLKASVDKMSRDVDSAFGFITNNAKLNNNLETLTSLESYDNTMVAQAVGSTAEAVKSIIDNFSIGKFVTAFIGVTVNSALVASGLDTLPPINFDKMMVDFRGKLNRPLFETDVEFDDLVNYDPEAYNDLRESFESELRVQREEMLSKKQTLSRADEEKIYANASINVYNNMSKEERKQIKSAINEIQGKREKVKNARSSRKMKDVVKDELKKLQQECKRFATNLKKDWENMLKTYTTAIREISTFFHGGGPGDQYVEDLCLDINDNCDKIKQLCMVDLPLQISNSSMKVALPYCIGAAIPNYLHNIVSFIVDLKVILKFLIDLLKYVMNIINDVNKLARLFLNGLKKLADIIKQIMDIIGLGWFMDLVQTITSLFKKTVTETTKTMEGMLQPVILSNSSRYNDWVDEVEAFIKDLENEDLSDRERDYMIYSKGDYINGVLTRLYGKTVNFSEFINNPLSGEPITYSYNGKTFMNYDTDEVINQLRKQLEYVEEIKDSYVVAYRSPVFKNGGDGTDPTQVVSWIYYHPNLKHLGEDIKFNNIHGEEFNYKQFGSLKDRVAKDVRRDNFMEVNSKKPNNKWMQKAAVNLGTSGNDVTIGRAFDIDSDTTINAYELYYWYRDDIGDGDWTRIKWPDGVIDGDNTGKLEDILEPGVDIVDRGENGSVVRIKVKEKDEEGNIQEVSKIVWVRDKNLRTGDWVLVEGIYYQVF